MKFKTSQSELNKALNFVSKAVTTRSTMPILKGILLKVTDDGKLTLTASDMEFSIEKTILVSDAEEGMIVLPARLFADIIRKLPNETVNISSGDFYNVISINKEIFREMIRKTSFAASVDESRGVIVGVLIEIHDGNINMAALDGFRMSVASEKTDITDDTDIIIAARILNEISKIISESDNENENIELVLDKQKAVIVTDDSRIILRIIDGVFLKYRDLLPKSFTTEVNAEKNMLTDSIERASLFAKEGRNNLIKISVKGDNLQITSKSEAGDVNENIPVKKNGSDIEIGFNSKYLLDGLKAIRSDDIVLKFNTNVTPCILEPVGDENFTYLLLPVRIMA